MFSVNVYRNEKRKMIAVNYTEHIENLKWRRYGYKPQKMIQYGKRKGLQKKKSGGLREGVTRPQF